MTHKFIVFGLLFSLFLTYSCKNEPKTEKKDWNQINKQLIGINKYLVKEDVERIKSFIKRNDWQMQQTETGLWYEIYQDSNGKQAENNDIAEISFTVKLLDGTVCYSSETSGNLSFKIGKGNIENGVQEGILLMKENEKARFILPPHLAHGLVGDDNRIPPRSIIIYDIELITLH